MDAEGRLKILYVSHSSAIAAGAEKCLLTLLRHLDLSKFTPVVVLPGDGPLEKELKSCGIKTAVFPLRWWVQPAPIKTCGANLIERSAMLARFIQEECIDIVHTNTGVVVEGAIAAKMSNRPHIWHLHEILKGHPSMKLLFPATLANKFIGFLSDVVVVPSQALQKSIIDVISPDKISVIHNGIDSDDKVTQKKTFRKELGISQDCLLVCTVGHIIKEKGYDTFIETAKRVLAEKKEVLFLSIGISSDRELQRALNYKIKEASIGKNVKFLGYRNDVREIMREIDIYVVSSHTESFSLMTLEAMAAQKPVIATRCGGPEEIIIDGQTGILVPVASPDAMAEAILNMASAPEKRHLLGANGKKRFEDLFTADKYCKEFEKVYNGLNARTSLDPEDGILLDNLIEVLNNLLEEKDRQIGALLNSWSWRITSPLRVVLEYLRKWR